MDFDPEPYELLPAVLHYIAAVGSLLFVVALVAVIWSLASRGRSGPAALIEGIKKGCRDFAQISPRRVWALSMLTIREALRRKALMVFVVFAVLFMFAGWFLQQATDRPDLQVEVYVSFVLKAITWLVLPVVMILACWGLPEDIRARSLHTVVTKPVRRSEIVLGRIIGFISVSTLILLIMGGVGYVWILRQVPDPSYLVSRVPIYGKLRYTNRLGDERNAIGLEYDYSINVGDIWEFRNYIEGGTKSRALWYFEGMDADDFDDKLIIETGFESFRTHKGDMDRGLLARLNIMNAETGLQVPLQPFTVEEYTQNLHEIPRKLQYFDEDTQDFREVDLFEDLVYDGTLKIAVECLDANQYIGMARPDLFIRLPDRSFFAGYSKAILGIWLMLSIIVVIAVSASCFVKGPVAVLLTFSFLILGQPFRSFMEKMVTGEQEGGGPLEAWYRLIHHLNTTSELPASLLTNAMKFIDQILLNFLWVMQNLIPNFEHFRMSPYVANGFDVPWSAAMLPSLVVTIAYLLPCVLIGYFSLAMRELESK